MATRRSTRLISAVVKDNAENETKAPAPAAPKAINGSKKRKSTAKDNTKPFANGDNNGPSTPKRNKVTKKPSPDADTVTPARVEKLLVMPFSSGGVDGNTPPPPVNRLAVPNGTNAQLISPITHRLVASKPIDQVSPSKKSADTTTTKNVLDEALAHLIKIEPKLKPVIEKYQCAVFSPEGLAETVDPFASLVSGIISQQLSGAAAKSIKAKFVALFNEGDDVSGYAFPTPSQVCTKSIETLRTAGLSQRKAEYVLGLAEKFNNGEITTERLFSATYEDVLEELIKVRGLGKWSVEMFAVFGLKRLDVFSTGDLGVQRGMAALAGRDVSKLKGKGGKWKYMSEKEMEETAEKFKPYRSVFMWYCWRVEDVDTDAMEK